jgi:hypothetical protein
MPQRSNEALVQTRDVLLLAHQLGYRIPRDQAAYGIWQWDKLWKQVGFTSRPR